MRTDLVDQFNELDNVMFNHSRLLELLETSNRIKKQDRAVLVSALQIILDTYRS